MTHKLTIRAVGDRELEMTRMFDAPRELVFAAHTKPELVKRWLGVQRGWELTECAIDLRIGGAYRYVWRHAQKGSMAMGGVFNEIAAPVRLVSTELFDEPWYPGDAINTVVFTQQGERTLMTATTRYATAAARDGVLASPMEQGVVISYDNLERLVTNL